MKLNRMSVVLAVLVGLFCIWAAVGALTADGVGPLYALALLGGAALLGVGVQQRQASPRRSTILIVAGAAVPVAVFYWMVPIFLPLWIVVATLVVLSEPGRRRKPRVAA